MIDSEISVLQVEKRIRTRVKRQIDKTQREFFLYEQMKAIQKELGDEEGKDELGEIEDKIKKTKLSKEAREKATHEFKKLRQMSPMSAESTVVRNYLDWLLSIPWNKKTKIKKDLKLAQEILDNDHFGLEKVKERIVEYLAVQQRANKLTGPILCLVGPAGVGKTSLGKSIARATGRNFVRFSLGGVHDEAEIRGHRRTYIGSMPGRIIQELRRAGSRNPVMMLDEIDKLGADFRGDPASALLEVLDSRQNHAFVDHYLDVPFDLSQVIFIATANYLDPVPPALRDRMEVIEIPGYTDREKLEIARRYLVARQLDEHGLKADQCRFEPAALTKIINDYTHEAGVRELERRIAAVCRAIAADFAKGQIREITVTPEIVQVLLGPPRYIRNSKLKTSKPGVVTGLAWTPTGGEILHIETLRYPGKGNILLTGQIGDVMKESAQAALSLVKSRARELGIDPDRFKGT